jgi:hypothetical protein
MIITARDLVPLILLMIIKSLKRLNGGYKK